jgi:pSer/pThr/pTyr-binding forkhead associated (FHA) protein
MPTLVVHEMGKDARVVTVQKDRIGIGRDPNCELPLANITVSRQHAEIVSDGKNWELRPLSQDNPLILNGKIIKGGYLVAEGAEIQLGRYLIIFSLEDQAQDGYRREREYQYEGTCKRCRWKGTVSLYNKNAVCPACGADEIVRVEAGKGDEPGAAGEAVKVAAGATSVVAPGELARIAKTLLAAKRARLERTAGGSGASGGDFLLSDDKPVTIGKGAHATLALSGLALGKPALLAWKGKAWVVRQQGFWPGLRVNGERVQEKALKDGDEIRLGKDAWTLRID